MGKAIDESGNKYGKLTVVKRVANKGAFASFLCRCDCGGECVVTGSALRCGKTKSCGCILSPSLVGQKFGYLTVVSKAEGTKHGGTLWNCRCICGGRAIYGRWALKGGEAKTCGCSLRGELKLQKTHGKCGTPEYSVWCDMKQRCNNPNNAWYHRYGGRGISVCKPWNDSFENFFADIGERPNGKLSIDRINNNGDYEPGNCKWSTAKEQTLNREPLTHCKYLTVGPISDTISHWAKFIGCSAFALYRRLKVHPAWTDEEIIMGAQIK